MTAKQSTRELLQTHRSTAALFARCVPAASVPDALYYRTSRWRSGSAPNPLEDLATVLRSIGPDEAAEIVAFIEDVFEDCHGGECPDFKSAMLAEAAADAAEDEIQVRAAMDSAALMELVSRSRRQEAAGRTLRRAAMREHQSRHADPRRTPRRSRQPHNAEMTA